MLRIFTLPVAGSAKSTRLLNSDMNGSTVELVASSWIEALGGLSRWYIFSTPPLFCASATPEFKTRAAMRPPVRIIGRIVFHP